MDTASPAKKSDLGVRTVSTIVMLAVAGTALWLGGWVWAAFVALVAFGVWFEWGVLVMLAHPPGAGRTAWRAAGLVYCGMAAAMLLVLREGPGGIHGVLAVAGAVVATDIFAYFAGRTIGGPKIAPKVSPSKTWAGLAGGAIGATLALLAVLYWDRLQHTPVNPPKFGFDGGPPPTPWLEAFVGGPIIAIVAQTGDFFESWMKRRAGVKDSGKLIPGHGGLFDRVDGLLAVLFVLCVIFLVSRLWGGS